VSHESTRPCVSARARLSRMVDRLEGPRAKVERAKKHLVDLQTEISEFLSHEPYSVVPDDESEPGKHIDRVRVNDDPPPLFALIAGDLIHNLRSVWDHLAWQLVLANDGAPSGRTEFPVQWGSTDEDKARTRRAINGMSDDAMKLVDASQPYRVREIGREPEDHPLYVIHKLDIEDKHHRLLIVGCAFTGAKIHAGRPGEWNPGAVMEFELFTSPRRVFPLKDGAILWTYSLGELTNVPVNSEATFDVAFDVPGVVKGQPVVPLCKQLIETCERGLEPFRPFLD
jgi:hypothetical protein